MGKEEIKQLIREELDKELIKLHLKEPKQEKSQIQSIYNRMYMRDTWYGD